MTMASNPVNHTQLFLEGLKTREVRDTFDHLKQLVETLEIKNDPESTEIRLVDSIYAFLEKLSLLENNLSSYFKENPRNLSGSKLSQLYDDISHSGSIYRD